MRPIQRRQDANRPLEILDLSQKTEIVNAKFTETDPRFRKSDMNKLNPNSEGKMSGIENSQSAADYRAYTALRTSILKAGDTLVQAKAAEQVNKEDNAILQDAGQRYLENLENINYSIDQMSVRSDMLSELDRMLGKTDSITTKVQKDEMMVEVRGVLEKAMEDNWMSDEERKKLEEYMEGLL